MGRNRLRRLPMLFMVLACVMVLSVCQQVTKFFGLDQIPVLIEVTKKPTKLTYLRGEAFDPTGMEVTATFMDGGKGVLASSEYTVAILSILMTPTDMNTTGKKIVEVTCEGVLLPAWFDIAVVVETQTSAYLDYITVTAPPTKTQYVVGEVFDPDGLVITATYVGKESRELADFEYTLSKPDMDVVGAQPVVVFSAVVDGNSDNNGKVTSFIIFVLPAPDATVASIAVTEYPLQTDYLVNDIFDPEGLVITATYSDASEKEVTASECSFSTPDMTSVGTKTVTVTFEGKTTTFDIMVGVAQLDSISVTSTPTRTVYYVNDVFDPAGLVVTAAYSDNSTQRVTSYSLSSPVMSSTGEKTVTVTYNDTTTRFSIMVINPPPPELDSIAVTPPTKAVYAINEPFNPAGLAVTGVYSDKSTKAIASSEYSLSTPDMSSAGTKTVTVTFIEKGVTKAASFNITVNEAQLVSLTVQNRPAKTTYFENEAFNPDGLAITGTYEGGGIRPVTTYSLSAPDMSSLGEKTITVTFEGKTATFKITVNAPALLSIAVTSTPSRTVYAVGETFSSAGLVVTGTYEYGSTKAISGYTLSPNPPDMSSAGTKTITVTFNGQTAAFTIVVDPPAVVLNSIAVTTNPSKITYFVGETFNPAGMVVTGTNSDNSKTVITAAQYSLSSPDMSSAGTKTVAVSFADKTTSFTITVNPIVLNSIAVTGPTKTVYYENEAFNSAGLVVTGTYSNGSQQAVTGYTFAPPDMSSAGQKTVTVTFEGKTASFAITVNPPQLLSIAVTTTPTKTVYFVNETFNPAGLVVTGTYEGNSTKAVTGYTLNPNPPDMSSLGEKTITVTFEGKTATFKITVTAAPVVLNSIAVTTTPTKTVYFVGESFSSTGLVVTATYSDNSTQTVTGYTLSSPAMSSAGTKTVAVSFEDKTTSFTITVNPIVLNSIAVTGPTKTVYYENEAFNSAGLIVTGTYSNGSQPAVTGYTFAPPDMSSAGQKTVTVTFEGKTASFTITVNPPQLLSIAVTTTPTKTVYFVNETFNPAGLVVTGTYEGNSTKAIATGYTLSTPTGSPLNTIGTQTVTVTFESKTDSFNITVNTPQLVSIAVTANPTNTVYITNDVFSSAGLAVAATYSNGSTQAVTGWTLSSPVMSSAGTKTVTVTFTENGVTKTASFTITVNPAPLVSIAVTTLPTKTVYFVRERFSSVGIVVTATYQGNNLTRTINGVQYTMSSPDMSSVGTKTVTVTFTDNGVTKTTSFTITVKTPQLERIEVAATPNKTVYTEGDTFSSTGLWVMGFNEDGSMQSIALSQYTLSTPDMSTAGTKTIIVTYTSSSNILPVSFTITVNPAPLALIAVTTPPTKSEYIVGETFNSAGLVITGTYSNNTQKTLTGYTLSVPNGSPLNTIGTQTVTVDFDGKTTSFTIKVTHPKSDVDVIIY